MGSVSVGSGVAELGSVGSGSTGSGRVGRQLAHAIVPIAAGYVIAHYLTLFVLEGQHTVALLADPLGTGADWLGTGGWTVQAFGLTPAGVASLQVTVIVIGHVLGTVLAHDRALVLFRAATAIVGQVPLLALMVAYTALGLWLLFAA